MLRTCLFVGLWTSLQKAGPLQIVHERKESSSQLSKTFCSPGWKQRKGNQALPCPFPSNLQLKASKGWPWLSCVWGQPSWLSDSMKSAPAQVASFCPLSSSGLSHTCFPQPGDQVQAPSILPWWRPSYPSGPSQVFLSRWNTSDMYLLLGFFCLFWVGFF